MSFGSVSVLTIVELVIFPQTASNALIVAPSATTPNQLSIIKAIG